jgi:hypothetical protein
VTRKYGAQNVSQIITFGTMKAKAVIRDVGRVLDLGFNFVDQFAKLIPNELGITLKDALEKEPLIRGRIDAEEEVAELWALALKLEGLTRNVGMHAGGVLIAPGKLTDFCPLYSRGRHEFGGVAIRQGRRREGGSGQVRLPRLAHADHHSKKRCAWRGKSKALGSTSPHCRSTIAKPMTRCSRPPTPRRCSSSNPAA